MDPWCEETKKIKVCEIQWKQGAMKSKTKGCCIISVERSCALYTRLDLVEAKVGLVRRIRARINHLFVDDRCRLRGEWYASDQHIGRFCHPHKPLDAVPLQALHRVHLNPRSKGEIRELPPKYRARHDIRVISI